MSTCFKYGRILLLIMAVASVSTLKATAGPRRKPASAITPQGSIEAHWENRTKARSEKQTERADQELNAILLLRLEEGIHNLYTYSVALLLEALEADRMDEPGRVAELLGRARDLAPDFAGPDFCEARIRLRRGQIVGAVTSYLKGSKQKRSSFQGSIPFRFNILSVALSGMFWTVILFTATLIARYVKLFAHDLEERIPGFSGWGALALALSVLFFPVAFSPNLALYAFIVMLMLWLYMRGRERIIAAVFALLIMFTPFPFKVLGYSLAGPIEPPFRSMVRIREGIWGGGDIRVLAQARQSTEDKMLAADMTFSEASALLHSGRFDEAEPLFKELENSGLAFEATLMLGNLYYQRKEYGKALKQYEAATKLNPESLEAHFNLAAALSRPELVGLSADYVERAEQELERAKQIDTKRLAVLTRYQVLTPGRMVADVRLPIERLYYNLMSETPPKTATTQAMFSELSGGVPLSAAPVISIILLVIMGILTAVGTKVELARSCKRCGKTFCHRCQTSGGEDVCVRCFSAFEQTAGMDPRAREKVRAESRLYVEHRGRLAQLMSIFLPGSGHLLLGRSVKGVIFALVASMFILGIIHRGGILRSTWASPTSAVILPVIFATVIYIIFVAIVAWNASASSR